MGGRGRRKAANRQNTSNNDSKKLEESATHGVWGNIKQKVFSHSDWIGKSDGSRILMMWGGNLNSPLRKVKEIRCEEKTCRKNLIKQ